MANSIEGYLWIAIGFFLAIIYGGNLLLQLLAVCFGFYLIFKGLRILSLDRSMYNYSQDFFNDRFKR